MSAPPEDCPFCRIGRVTETTTQAAVAMAVTIQQVELTHVGNVDRILRLACGECRDLIYRFNENLKPSQAPS